MFCHTRSVPALTVLCHIFSFSFHVFKLVDTPITTYFLLTTFFLIVKLSDLDKYYIKSKIDHMHIVNLNYIISKINYIKL